jgi:hypothetical protein
MDTGRFDGIIARSLLLPHKRRVFGQSTVRNGVQAVVGAAMFSLSGSTAVHDTADGEWSNFATTGSINSTNGVEDTVASGGFMGRPDGLPIFFARIRLEQITDVRFWAGLTDFAGGAFMASDDPTQHEALFRFSTSAGDTKFQCVRNDNSGGGTIVDSGVTVQASTVYELMIRFVTSGFIEWWINGVRVAQASSGNMPSTSAAFGNICEIRTLAAAVKNLRIQSLIGSMNA